MSLSKELLSLDAGFSAFGSGFDAPNVVWDAEGLCSSQGFFKGTSAVALTAGQPMEFAVLGATAPVPGSSSKPVGVATLHVGSAYVPGIVYMTYEGFLQVQANISGTVAWCAYTLFYSSH